MMISANKKEISMLSETELDMVSGGKWYPWSALFMGKPGSDKTAKEKEGKLKETDQKVTYAVGGVAAIASVAGLAKCAVPSGIFSKLASHVKSIAG